KFAPLQNNSRRFVPYSPTPARSNPSSRVRINHNKGRSSIPSSRSNHSTVPSSRRTVRLSPNTIPRRNLNRSPNTAPPRSQYLNLSPNTGQLPNRSRDRLPSHSQDQLRSRSRDPRHHSTRTAVPNISLFRLTRNLEDPPRAGLHISSSPRRPSARRRDALLKPRVPAALAPPLIHRIDRFQQRLRFPACRTFR
ncbi:MAG: hypothetical protein JWQ49_6382, partial [Edaphobacter sp.]|nr:hypothetical protein [Edaphobacter sp.]